MDELVRLFREAGSKEYIGEPISQEDHGLQAAKCAADAGADEDAILGALLHDVGHLLGVVDPGLPRMKGDLGVEAHERIGASYLLALGLPIRTAKLVLRHVDAKRYLCAKNPAYHAKLSEASKATLAQQGGPMTPEEAAAFESDPLKDAIIRMRTWDEAAKVEKPRFHVPTLESYRPMVERAIQRERERIEKKEFKHYKLTKEQTDGWRRDGFIKLTDLLSPDQKKQIVAWVTDIQQWPETPGKHMCYYEKDRKQDGEDKLILCRTENFVPYHRGLRELLSGPGPVADVLEQLMHEPAVIFKEKINYKMAGGGGFPAHQDGPAFSSFGQRNHLTFNVSIDAANPGNGCLQVAPGHHARGRLPQDPRHRGLTAKVEAMFDNWTDVKLDPGDVLIFSSWLPHRSGPNRSDRSRRALYVTYNGETDGDFRDRYYEEKRRAFPQLCERVKGVDYSKGAEIFNQATPIVE